MTQYGCCAATHENRGGTKNTTQERFGLSDPTAAGRPRRVFAAENSAELEVTEPESSGFAASVQRHKVRYVRRMVPFVAGAFADS